jgi:TPP-dependent pyruvate/acetoin dehydrogenase alpha subunit
MFDPELYRSKEEVEHWKAHGPVRRLEDALNEAGLLEDERLRALEEDVHREVEDAVEFARASEFETTETLMRFVTSERSPS